MNLRNYWPVIFLCIASCSYGQEHSDSTKTISAYTANIDLTKGTADWASGIAAAVFDTTLPEKQKTTEFTILKQGQYLLVNSEIPFKSGGEDTKNCETLKKTCRSEQCVADTLIHILGDGDRNVVIKYERKLLSVQIYYTYQDCQ